MTKTQKEMLAEIAAGADPNMLAQLARFASKREGSNVARTMLALFRAGMLQVAKGSGLEISEAGRKAAAKIRPAAAAVQP